MAEYRNPQSEPGGDKRMLIALLSVFVVLGLMQLILPKPAQPPPNQQQSQQSQPAAAQPSATPPAVPAQTQAGRPAPKSPAAAVKIPVKRADTETESVLDNGVYRITFTNRGAVVKSWILTEK